MLLFVKHYKQEVLGVGEVALPGEGGALREAAIQRTAKEAKDRSSSSKKDAVEHQDHGSTSRSAASAAGSTNGTDESTKTEYVSKHWVDVFVAASRKLKYLKMGNVNRYISSEVQFFSGLSWLLRFYKAWDGWRYMCKHV